MVINYLYLCTEQGNRSIYKPYKSVIKTDATCILQGQNEQIDIYI